MSTDLQKEEDKDAVTVHKPSGNILNNNEKMSRMDIKNKRRNRLVNIYSNFRLLSLLSELQIILLLKCLVSKGTG
jgi:hypothetical protein